MVERVESESFGLLCPELTDSFERRQASKTLEALREVVRIEKGCQVAAFSTVIGRDTDVSLESPSFPVWRQDRLRGYRATVDTFCRSSRFTDSVRPLAVAVAVYAIVDILL